MTSGRSYCKTWRRPAANRNVGKPSDRTCRKPASVHEGLRPTRLCATLSLKKVGSRTRRGPPAYRRVFSWTQTWTQTRGHWRKSNRTRQQAAHSETLVNWTQRNQRVRFRQILTIRPASKKAKRVNVRGSYGSVPAGLLCSAGSIDTARKAVVGRVPCKLCIWQRVGCSPNPP